MATLTRKRKYEEVRWSLSHSSLAVCCTGVSAFRFPIVGVLSLVAITTIHCTVHMSVAWWRGSVGTCNLSVSREWDGHGRMVSRSVNVCGPIDHTSVGLAQARPNCIYIPWSDTPPELLTSIPRNVGYTHFYYSMHLGLYPVVGKARNAIVTVSLLPLSSSIRIYSSSKVSMKSVWPYRVVASYLLLMYDYCVYGEESKRSLPHVH